MRNFSRRAAPLTWLILLTSIYLVLASHFPQYPCYLHVSNSQQCRRSSILKVGTILLFAAICEHYFEPPSKSLFQCELSVLLLKIRRPNDDYTSLCRGQEYGEFYLHLITPALCSEQKRYNLPVGFEFCRHLLPRVTLPGLLYFRHLTAR